MTIAVPGHTPVVKNLNLAPNGFLPPNSPPWFHERMTSRRATPILWCLGAAALFGASTPAAKALLGGMGPIALAGLLYLGAALGVLPFSFRGGSRALRRKPRNVLMLLGAVLFGGGLGPVLLLDRAGERWTTVLGVGMVVGF